MTTNTGVFLHTVTVSGGSASPAIDVGKLKDVTVQVVRTGSTDTLTVQMSNDATNWVTAHSRMQTTAGVPDDLSGLSAGVHTLLEVPRYIRVNPSGSTDSFVVTVAGPASRG